jgi:hypothetical protein
MHDCTCRAAVSCSDSLDALDPTDANVGVTVGDACTRTFVVAQPVEAALSSAITTIRLAGTCMT